MGDSQTILACRLIKSEFTAPLERDNNPYDINFNFSLRVEFSEWLIPTTTNDSPDPQLVGRVDSSVIKDYPFSMSRQQFYRLEEARKTMEKNLRGLVGNPFVRRKLVEYACDKALRRLDPSNTPSAESDVVLNLHIELVLMIIYQYVSLEDQSFRMVPAADSSVQGLKRAVAADYVGRNLSCSICLEEFSVHEGSGDGSCEEEGLLIMPCSHVFHGGCIKKWLSVSHYCPLCRLELPTSN